MNEVDGKVDDALKNVSLRDQNKQIAVQPKKNGKNKGILGLAILGVATLVLFAGNDPLINDIFPEEELTPESSIDPADVHLYIFSDPHDNVSVNVEFWLINIGEEIATDIEVFIRARNHNGTILFSEVVDTTALLLRENETCSGMYIVEYGDAEYLDSTIEIGWSEGRNSYQKKTIIVGFHSTG